MEARLKKTISNWDGLFERGFVEIFSGRARLFSGCLGGLGTVIDGAPRRVEIAKTNRR